LATAIQEAKHDGAKSEVATPKAAVKSAESVKASAKKSKKEKRAVQ